MITLLVILVILAMLATLGVLFAGMMGLARGGGSGDEERARHSNVLMRWRIIFQAVALLLFVLLLSLLKP